MNGQSLIQLFACSLAFFALIASAFFAVFIMRSGEFLATSLGLSRNRLRTAELARWAQNEGLDFTEEGSVAELGNLPDHLRKTCLNAALPIVSSPTHLRNVLRWESDLAEYWIFDLEKGAESDRRTVGLIAFAKRQLPRFKLYPRQQLPWSLTILDRVLFENELRFDEDSEFTRNWVLLSPQETETRALFNSGLRREFSPETLRFHIQAEDQVVLFGIPATYAYRDESLAVYRRFAIELANALDAQCEADTNAPSE